MTAAECAEFLRLLKSPSMPHPKEIWIAIDMAIDLIKQHDNLRRTIANQESVTFGLKSQRDDLLTTITSCYQMLLRETNTKAALAKAEDILRSAMVGEVGDQNLSLRQQLSAAQKEIEKLKTIPMKYRRMEFNAQLQQESALLQADNEQLVELLRLRKTVGNAAYEQQVEQAISAHKARQGKEQQ